MGNAGLISARHPASLTLESRGGMSTDAWTSRETFLPIGRRTAARAGWIPPYGLSDFVSLLWRERLLMLGVFVVIFALGLAASLAMKKSYQAYSSLVVQLGEEYVYNPRVGDAGRGAAAAAGQIMQSELEILGSATVKERALQRIGLARLYPKLGAAYAKAGRAQQRLIWGAAIKAMGTSLKIESAPETSVVRLAFTHEDPILAAQALNTLVEEYMDYRKTVLVGGDAGVLDEQRRLFEDRLRAADAEYQAFLAESGIGDFDTEKASLAQVYGALLTERYAIQAQLSEAEGRFSVTSRQAAAAPPEIGLYQDADPTAGAKLTALRVDRQDLLSRYRPDSQPVREIDQKIAALQALISGGGAVGVAARRVGVNPVYQSLQTEKNQLEAQAASLRRRQASVIADLAQVSARRQQLTALEPRYQDLVRQREVLAANVRSFNAREQESQAARAIALGGEDNIRVVQRAFAPTKGTSLRKAVIAAAFLFAAFTALCAGLLRILLRRGYVTADATARSFELPVLASAPLKRAAG
jgi:uncharacterized protein involved in exopolysaccharide biosynthesis